MPPQLKFVGFHIISFVKILYFSNETIVRYNETDEIIYANKDELLKNICEDT